MTNAERQAAFRNRQRNVTSHNAVTDGHNVTPTVTERKDWPWDEKHIYQLCPHGKRYCRECGTTAEPFTASVEQWAAAYRIMLSAAERNKGHKAEG